MGVSHVGAEGLGAERQSELSAPVVPEARLLSPVLLAVRLRTTYPTQSQVLRQH
jgi:hypothetical protein